MTTSPRIGELGERTEVVCQLVERAVATIPFYTDHLGGHDVGDFASLPTTMKQPSCTRVRSKLRSSNIVPLAPSGVSSSIGNLVTSTR